MVRSLGWCLALVLLVGTAQAEEPQGRLVEETWDAAFLDGFKAGFFHIEVREVPGSGGRLYRTTLDMNLTLKRFNDAINMRMETGTTETGDGRVTGVFMRQFLGKQQQMLLTGTVLGDQLHVKVTGGFQMDKKIRWNEQVVGLYRQQRLFREKKVKPGDSFQFHSYEPSFNTVVGIRATAKDTEEVEVFGTKQKLLRVDAVPDKLEIQGGSVQLPAMAYWLDRNLGPVRSQTEVPGLGKVVLYRTTKAVALLPSKLPEKGGPALDSVLRLNQRIDHGVEADAVVYRITLPEDDDPGSAIKSDDRQKIEKVQGKSFEVHVKAVRGPKEGGNADARPGDEFLKSNYFLNSDDPKIQEHTRRAIGTETDPWKKARSIEAWVRANMKILNYTEAMATADHVARSLEGDCSEFAMLTAAMCRAAGIPSRTAIGLVYVEIRNSPSMAYHMWTEVFVRGQWIPLDATIGRGSIGAGHLKITDHSWADTQSLTPILPVMRLMLGKPAIEVVRSGGTN
jgi:hypothetical protein